jgi:Fe-S-cluster-containing hydrogenase component 2
MMPSAARLAAGPVAIIECTQNIPCNPCADACARGAIQPLADINECPALDVSRCNGCGLCLAHCPGLAIFVVDYSFSSDRALVKIPYEFLPLPRPGNKVAALNRAGERVGVAEVVKVQEFKNKTAVIWLAVPTDLANEVRNIEPGEGDEK